ncbi:MAG: 50S ribosomal protein L16 [Candidatus Paceibacterota bacterium]
MLEPKKQKYRKQQKGRSRKRGKTTRGTGLDFGSVGLQSLSSAWITANQIEAARKTITRRMKREGKVWIRIFPDKPVTSFPPEVGMGKGKGAVDRYVAAVAPGHILFEVDGVDESLAFEALKLAGHKLPVKTKIVTS